MTVVVISICILGGFLASDKVIAILKARPTLGLSGESIDEYYDVRFLLPKRENAGLATDLRSTFFDNDEWTQYLIVPNDLKVTNLIVYCQDSGGNYLNRYVIDFTKTPEYSVGKRKLILKRTNLPILSIVIDSESPSFADLVASKKDVECFGELALSVDKDLAHKNHWIEEVHSKDVSKSTLGSMTLRGRGNSSWDFPQKKSFTVEFEKATYILGLGKHKKWSLIANAMDQSLLNNEVFLQMASDMGVAYEPKCEQVTLYVDGFYQGVYLLTTKVSVDKDRVDLKKGDYFINWGGTGAEQPLFYDSTTWLDDGSDYPDPFVELEWPENATKAQQDEIQGIVQRFISTIEDTSDTHYTDLLDLDSMVRYYWAQEICMNYDAAFRSTYSYYKANTGKLYMGPVWDLDLCLGWNADKCGADYRIPEGWKLRGSSWYVPLFEREDFRKAAADAYWNGGVRDAMYAALANYETRIRELENDGDLNYRYWRSDVPNLGIIWGDIYKTQAMGRLQFFKDRVRWIDATMQSER